MKLLSKIKIVIIAIIGFIASLLIAYFKGKQSEKIKNTKETLNEVKKAKKARDTLSNPDTVKRLHKKYNK